MDLCDNRKNFLKSTSECYFNTSRTSKMSFDFENNGEVDKFLNDINCSLLSVISGANSPLVSTHIPPCDDNQPILIFYKTQPVVVSEENLHQVVFLTSMVKSPLVGLHHSLQHVFAPALLEDEKWSCNIDPLLQTLINDLGKSVKSSVLGEHAMKVDRNHLESNSVADVLSIDDELLFWNTLKLSSKKKSETRKFDSFIQILESLKANYDSIVPKVLVDSDELCEVIHNSLDDLWKVSENEYPESRMKHLVDIISNSVCKFILKELRSLDLWHGPLSETMDLVKQGSSACEKFISVCDNLTTMYWPNHSTHVWTSGTYVPSYIQGFGKRLKQIMNLRTVNHQLTRLLSAREQEEFSTNLSFKPFSNLNPMLYSPYTENIWSTAVNQYETNLIPVEERVAYKLKEQLHSMNATTLQYLQEFKRYQSLIVCNTIGNYLQSERENLLEVLKTYIDGLSNLNFEIESQKSMEMKIVDMPALISSIHWIRQIEGKVNDIDKTSKCILIGLKGFDDLNEAIMAVKKQLKDFHSEKFDSWSRDTIAALENKKIGLRTDEPVVYFEQTKLMRVSYSPQLIKLIREVQQLQILGYRIPDQIQKAADLGKKFMSQAMALEQAATFHNTIGDRMIASQRPMMLSAAVELARLVQSQNNVTWSDTKAVDFYIAKLQNTIQTLALQNDTLASYHRKLTEKVMILMDTDLIRHQSKWKEILGEMRDVMKEVEKSFTNTISWKTHWNHQLYKALEHRYQLGLESLNDHLPEMKIELVFRQQKLQFNPPIEEIRSKYYNQLKKFLAIPMNFRGVFDSNIFQVMVERNSSRFLQAFNSAEILFTRLFAIHNDWLDRVALGSVDLEQLVSQNLQTSEDWDANFKSSKIWGQEVSRLITCDHRLECFTVSCAPVLSEIELHNRRYWDVLVVSLQSTILRDISLIENFIAESRSVLEKQPQSLMEIGEANALYMKVMNSSKEMAKLINEIDKKNNVLSSWTKERVEQVNDFKTSWDNFEHILNNQKFVISQQVENMKNQLATQTDNLKTNFEKFAARWEQLRPKETDALDVSAAVLQANITLLKEKREEWNQLCQNLESVKQDYIKFSMEPPDFSDWESVGENLKQHEDTWSLYENFSTSLEEIGKEEWIVVRNKIVQKMDDFVSSWNDKLTKQQATPLTVRLLQELEHYKVFIPCLKYLRGDVFSDKHWVELFSIIEQPYKPAELIIFSDFLRHKEKIKDNITLIQELNIRAANEIVIRQALSELDIWEVDAKFTMMKHLDSKKHSISLIKDFKNIMNKVGDNQCLLQSIKSSPNYEHFLDRASLWEGKMSDLDLHLRNLSQIQRKWLYLEPIFESSSLNIERGRFQRIDRDFRFILSDILAGGCRVITLTRINNIHNILETLLSLLTSCQNSLNQFLEKKRSLFPRFYFLSDEDLLEILGQSSKPQVVQLHLKKLFAGIHNVVFNSENTKITSMVSLEGEVVNLSTPVTVTLKVEEWLENLASEMRKTLKELVVSCLRSPDPTSYPSQVLCVAESISFTRQCEDAIVKGTLPTLLSVLKSQLEKHTSLKLDSKVMELKLKALVMDTIYHLRVVSELIESSVSTLSDWKWQKKLRFYLRNDNVVVIRMLDAEFLHSYEYEGNAQKLVHTPLTDRCYLTLTQAIHSGLGGNPYGPAGTGKTESVKALGSLLGRQVLVFNCDEGIDVHSLTRIFVGLVKCGAWGCFDEFNRLEEATLSAISMQIHLIQEALQSNKNKLQLMDQEVDLNSNTGIFVTLNPAGQGYGGRQKLPDNLKQLFRPVVMSQPDDNLIAQVMLQCHGFRRADALGLKIVQIFDSAKKLLSSQKHYDWGLRALKTVINSCGNALKVARLKATEEDLDVNEAVLVVEALRLNTLSKLTFADSNKFDLLVKDIFLKVEFQSNSHSSLVDQVKNGYKAFGLTYNARQERKCIELYEQLQQRMGVVIVGPSGSGKSTICKILKYALGKLGWTLKQHTINPKAMHRTQLLGHIDLDTRQWTDGVINLTAQQVYSEPETTHSWVICDGDIDPEWIESLNSVLDDNRLLTLPSGWRIQFGPNVNFIFETHDLTHASPATISRMGVILLSEADTDANCIVDAWLRENAMEDSVLPLLNEYYFHQALSWIQTHGEFATNCSIITIVKTFLSQLYEVNSKSHFAVALINGLGANLTLSSRNSFAKQVFAWTNEIVPDSYNAMFCRYNLERDCVETLSIPLHDEVPLLSLVLTAQVQTALNIIKKFTLLKLPFILVGAQGSGKSLLLKHCVSELRNIELTTISCSASVTPAHVLQKLSQFCMLVSSNSGRVYRPKNSEHLIIHFKNLNLARPDKWGTNILVAFLQQIITYNGFFEPVSLEWVGLDKIQVICSVTSCESLSPRLISLFKVLHIGTPELDELKNICSAYLKNVLKKEEQYTSVASVIVALYREVKEAFNPSLDEHNFFSPHSLSSLCVGLKRYPIEDSNSLIEALTYEASRIFRDRLSSAEERTKFDGILSRVLDEQWSTASLVVGRIEDSFYVCENYCGQSLVQLSSQNWALFIEKAINQLENDGQNVDSMLVTPELLTTAAQFERVLTDKNGSLFLPGCNGLGRKTAIQLIAARQNARMVIPKTGQSYTLSHFKNDLKSIIQQAGIENEQIYFILEDHNLVFPEIMDLLNSFSSSGEIPGLYQVEELETLTNSLKSDAENCGKSPFEYFFDKAHNNLHVILILDPQHVDFSMLCAQNPFLYKHCSVIWTSDWSAETMRIVAKDFLLRKVRKEIEKDGLFTMEAIPKVVNDGVISVFEKIHNQARKWTDATLKQYVAFVNSYWLLYKFCYKQIIDKQLRLQAGVSKLTEARDVVDKLKKEATEQELKLAEKQNKATLALEMITNTMKSANTQKGEMENLKEEFEKENVALSQRKKEIDAELTEVEPLINAAQSAVGNIKSESLSEIRSLRAPPDVIRDILEGVLRLMGIQDTSWNSMKSFLAKRGVKEDIRYFDVRKINIENRESVEQLLRERKESFDAKIAHRASAAAAPLATWVTANVKYSQILEKIRPLEREQSKLQQKLKLAEEQIGELSSGLDTVDKRVAELKEQLNVNTKDAVEIELNLNRAKETLIAAESLVMRLDEEYLRWQEQLTEIASSIETLDIHSLLVAAFIIYLPSSSQDLRQRTLQQWQSALKVDDFSFSRFLSSEREQSQWVTEGLSSDQFSFENAFIILKVERNILKNWLTVYKGIILKIGVQSINLLEMNTETLDDSVKTLLQDEILLVLFNLHLTPYLIDPSSMACDWIKKHLSDRTVEIVTQSDSKFHTVLELAIRFGKVLIVQDVNLINSILIPILRGNFVFQGPRKLILIGEKLVDYDEKFKLILACRNVESSLPPNQKTMVVSINFSLTKASLAQQLLSCVLKIEKPDLEAKSNDLLKKEETLKVQLHELQENVLRQLANSQGNILYNQELLSSLNNTKENSEAISASLIKSGKLQDTLKAECDAYKALIDSASILYFTLQNLKQLNIFYQISVQTFTRLFEKTLTSSAQEIGLSNKEEKFAAFLHAVYNFMSRSLFKSDRLTFALHLVHSMHPELFQPNEWELLIGQAVGDLKLDTAKLNDVVPQWIDKDRAFDVFILQSVLPDFYAILKLEEEPLWQDFVSKGDQIKLPGHCTSKVSSFQFVLIVQALRPDRLHSTLTNFALKSLGLNVLSPPVSSLKSLLSETSSTEPVLFIISPGTDPSTELRDLAASSVAMTSYHEIVLGQGQTEAALKCLRESSEKGHWLVLKNLHLMTHWLQTLEKELKTLTPHQEFRLWLTSELHPHFSNLLARSSLKVAYEVLPNVFHLESVLSVSRESLVKTPVGMTNGKAPPGVKRNLLHSFSSWLHIRPKNSEHAAAMFILAWFHAVVQERRTYIPQGWVTNYEFKDADLSTAINFLHKRIQEDGSKGLRWEYLRGLCLDSIYGARIDNVYDLRILSSYLNVYFTSSALKSSYVFKNIRDVKMPSTSNLVDFFSLIKALPDQDDPQLFGLPVTVDRAWQKIRSAEVINQLKGLSRHTVQNGTLNQEEWKTQLSPILNLWKKLNQGIGFLQMKPAEAPKENLPLIEEFFYNELQHAIKLIHYVHKSLAAISRVIRGVNQPSQSIQLLAESLASLNVPHDWLNLWLGPKNPMRYVRSLIHRASAVLHLSSLKMSDILSTHFDLGDIYHPATFLSIIKQHSSRAYDSALDELSLKYSWSKNELIKKEVKVQLTGLQLEGVRFNGNRLEMNTIDSPTVMSVPDLTLAWIPKTSATVADDVNSVSLPLYVFSDRETAILDIKVPAPASEHDKWIQTGAAFYLQH